MPRSALNYIFSWNGSSRAAAITHSPRVCGYQSHTPGIRHAPGRVAASRRLKTQVCDEGVFFNLKTWLIAGKVCDSGTPKRLGVHQRVMIGESKERRRFNGGVQAGIGNYCSGRRRRLPRHRGNATAERLRCAREIWTASRCPPVAGSGVSRARVQRRQITGSKRFLLISPP